MKPIPPIDNYQQWLTTNKDEDLSKVLDDLSPSVTAEVHRYAGAGKSNLSLLRSKAKLLTVKAIKSFDPTQGAKLKSWVVTQMQPLQRYAQQLKPVYIPEVSYRQSAEVHSVRQRMTDDLGRAPTDEEMADEIGLNPNQIRKLTNAARPTMYESELVGPEESGGGEFSPAVSFTNPMGEASEVVYDSISDRDRQIFNWTTGKNGKAQISNIEIAKRLGITPSLVSQRAKWIANKILEAEKYVG